MWQDVLQTNVQRLQCRAKEQCIEKCKKIRDPVVKSWITLNMKIYIFFDNALFALCIDVQSQSKRSQCS